MAIARKSVFCAAVIGLAALAACQTKGPAAAPTSVDGSWMSADGAARATFSGGSFTTTSARSGNTLEQGSYVVSGATVQIIGTSVATQKPVSYSCTLASARQLNCSSASGQSFALIRRA
jgi:hypothetical protein